MIDVYSLLEQYIYLFFGLTLAGGVFGAMIGYGLASDGVYPDALNIILLSGVSIGIVTGWIFREIAAGKFGTGEIGGTEE